MSDDHVAHAHRQGRAHRLDDAEPAGEEELPCPTR